MPDHTEYMRNYRRTRKIQLLEAAGSLECVRCGWDETPVGLELHHRDPKTKEFTIGAHKGKAADQLAEAAKCVVLCGNCHAALHDGLFEIEGVHSGRVHPDVRKNQ